MNPNHVAFNNELHDRRLQGEREQMKYAAIKIARMTACIAAVALTARAVYEINAKKHEDEN